MRKIQLVLAWFCPVILSCHYYSPKLTHFTLAGALFGMLCATYIGLYCGVWDANMMRAGGAFELLKDKHGFVMAGMEDVKYREYELELKPGIFCFYIRTAWRRQATRKNSFTGRNGWWMP